MEIYEESALYVHRCMSRIVRHASHLKHLQRRRALENICHLSTLHGGAARAHPIDPSQPPHALERRVVVVYLGIRCLPRRQLRILRRC